MSHTTGRLVAKNIRIGPDSGSPAAPSGDWELDFVPDPALAGGDPRFVILRFENLQLPGSDRLEVDLGYPDPAYAKDVFTANAAEVWTRPIDPSGGPIRVTYIGSDPGGGATLSGYGSGEPVTTPAPPAYLAGTTNPDLFLHTNPFDEPDYHDWLQCGGVFDWQNAACLPGGSTEEAVAHAACILVAVHRDGASIELSSCSGTLIDSDLVLTARHCFTEPDELDIRSGSVTFDFQTNCAGARPAGYAPTFHKIIEVVAAGSPPLIPPVADDWVIVRIGTPPSGLGIGARPLRGTAPMASESVFTMHHPNGSVKKHQAGPLSSGSVGSVTGFDYGGGSSGSALFDAAGQVLGAALSRASGGSNVCTVSYTSARDVLDTLANPPAPPTPLDVMVVFDRSGSMASSGTSGPGRTKLVEAQEAAAMFVRMVREGAGDRLGLVSFSTTASTPVEATPAPVSNPVKNQIAGAGMAPGGDIGGLVAGGFTSIGDGVDKALNAFPGGPNQRVILLLTDGMQNTAPMVETVESGLGDTRLCVIGFGTEAQLDGPLLTRLASDHNGLYTRANDGLALKKFFATCFGDIFESGTLADPDQRLGRDQREGKPWPFAVCGEEAITVVIGWDTPDANLDLSLRTPGGATVTASSGGVGSDRGNTWAFLRVPLPHDGERDGTWQALVRRAGVDSAGEFTAPPVDVSYFVSVLATGGPHLRALTPRKRIYTGDPITPLVALHYGNGTAPHAQVELDIEAPTVALGQLVAEAGLETPTSGDDAVDPFTATLQKIEAEQGGFATSTTTVALYDDGQHEDGAMERDGVYGNPLPGLTRFEGTYSFRARATYGDGGCAAAREALWSVHVEPGIDPDRTDVEVRPGGRAPDGRSRGTIRFWPRDRYGNPLGPGRGNRFDAGALPGTSAGGTRDNGDGSYDIDVSWDPGSDRPGLTLTQPDRDPVAIGPAAAGAGSAGCPLWLCVLLAVLAVALLIALIAVLVGA
ncbi:MAG: trypsin-like peptidase domain-containing protein [Myxococcota bacterium]